MRYKWVGVGEDLNVYADDGWRVVPGIVVKIHSWNDIFYSQILMQKETV